MTKRGSLTSAKSLHEFKHQTEIRDSAATTTTAQRAISHPAKTYSEDDVTTKRGIRPSKSDTSLTESFVVVDGAELGGPKKNMNSLREGMCI